MNGDFLRSANAGRKVVGNMWYIVTDECLSKKWNITLYKSAFAYFFFKVKMRVRHGRKNVKEHWM